MISSKWARALEVGIHLNSTLERLVKEKKKKKLKCLETIFQEPSESDSTHTLQVFKIN